MLDPSTIVSLSQCRRLFWHYRLRGCLCVGSELCVPKNYEQQSIFLKRLCSRDILKTIEKANMSWLTSTLSICSVCVETNHRHPCTRSISTVYSPCQTLHGAIYIYQHRDHEKTHTFHPAHELAVSIIIIPRAR